MPCKYGAIRPLPCPPLLSCCDPCCPWPPVIGTRNVFDMTLDPCGKSNWQNCKAAIYGGYCSGPCCKSLCHSPCCRCPVNCPPPMPPPKGCLPRFNPQRPCGFIVKDCRPKKCCNGCGCACPCRPGCGDGPCMIQKFPSIPSNCRPLHCPIPIHCPVRPRKCLCHPVWKPPPVKGDCHCFCHPCLPPVSRSYNCWLSQFGPKVDTNLCPSINSDRIEKCGHTMVIVDPPGGS